jgi:iron complex outermembrane receptor protein
MTARAWHGFRLPLMPILALTVGPPAAQGEQADRTGRGSADSATVAVVVVHDSIPVSGAAVRAGAVVRRTDPRGRTAFRLAPGAHWLSAAHFGLAPDSALLALRAGQDTTITLRLTEPTAEMAALVVRATRSERRIDDEPLRVEVLTQEEVEEKLRMTPGDITMMLNESSGLRVQTTSASLGGANVRVQGLRGRYTLLLSDGLPLYGGQTGGLGLLQIPPMDLAGVEVIKGVASALYGGSALGGVINLVSRRPGPEPVRDLLVNQTTLGGTDLVGFAGGRAGPRWGYTLLAGAHRQSQVDRDGDGWTDLPGYRRLVIRPRAFWSAAAGHTVSLTAGTTLEGRDGGTLDGRVAPDGTVHPERLETRRLDAGGLARVALRGVVLSARASAAVQRHTHTFGAVREEDRHLTWFGETSVAIPGPGMHGVLGVALQQERYRARNVAGFDYTFTTPGAFAQGTFDVTDRLALTASTRLDHHSTYGTQLAPRLSALVRARPGWSVRASVGAGYFAPTPFTEETEALGLTPLEPLTGLRAERAWSGSLDVGGTLGAVEVNGTLFGSEIRHPVGLRDVAGQPGRVELVNLAGATRTAGGELLVRWKPEPFHVTGSYTYVHSREDDPETGARRIVPLTPRHQAGIVAAWELEDRARAAVEVYYTGPQSLDDNPYRITSRPYVHVGLMVERRVGPARVFVNAENLLGYRQTRYDPLVLAARGSGGRWTTDVWGPLEGRVANVGVRLDSR